jgi:hypothetical protein
MLLMHVHLSNAGDLELPLSTMLLVSVAPYQVMDLRYETFPLVLTSSAANAASFRILVFPFMSRSLLFPSFARSLLPIYRGTQGGAIVSLALTAYLAFQHFTRTGGIGKAFDQGSIIATVAIICITVINVILLLPLF